MNVRGRGLLREGADCEPDLCRWHEDWSENGGAQYLSLAPHKFQSGSFPFLVSYKMQPQGP